jgi:hypothetical protein
MSKGKTMTPDQTKKADAKAKRIVAAFEAKIADANALLKKLGSGVRLVVKRVPR